MSSSMPPPPSPLAHRRTHLHLNQDKSSCLPRKMSLSKGATFHVASSPSSDADPVLSIPHLSRRSPTCSHASLSNLLSEKRELAAQSIADFEQTFSGARGNSLSRRRRLAQDFNPHFKQVRPNLPTDEGLGSSIGSPVSEKGLTKSLARVELASNKDSGLGESVEGSIVDVVIVTAAGPEDDGLAAADLIQDTDHSDNTPIQPRHPRTAARRSLAPQSHINTSYLPAPRTSSHPPLSRFARRKISELIIQPILREEKYKDFHSLVNLLARRTSKNIQCLRDLEQSLIYIPLVSQLYPLDQSTSNNFSKTRRFSVSPNLYRSFGELTVQLTIDTYQHLSELDQRRATDPAYSSGYFLDLVQQVERLASHIGTSSETQTEEIDDDTPTVGDEVTLEGGLGTTGEFAELVRWRNGKGISLRTGLPYEPLPGIKRQHSSMSEEEIARSMARRKKGYIPEIIEMKCGDPTCDKIFNRKCDLAKHEKTHSRPFKCPHKNCKYHELGLPTEKEKERHVNDKHDPNPKLYGCNFCEFRTKRESNCKQHMEKKHNWEYKRAKGKDKDTASTPAQTPQTPAMDYSPAQPYIQQTPAQMSHVTFDDGSSVSGSMASSTRFTPVDANEEVEFDFNAFAQPLFPQRQAQVQPQLQPTQYVQNTNVNGYEASYNTGYDQFQGYVSPVSANMQTMCTPVTPAYSNITGQSPYLTTNHNMAGASNYPYWNEGLLTPESAAYPNVSRHPSVQYDSPMMPGQPMTNDFLLNQHMNDTSMDMDMEIPNQDFSLFGAFTNAGAGEQTLFPAEDFISQELDVSAFEKAQDIDMGDMTDPTYDLNAFINYDANN